MASTATAPKTKRIPKNNCSTPCNTRYTTAMELIKQHGQELSHLAGEASTLFAEFADSIRPEPKVKVAPKYRFYVDSDMVVVGHNPEMADFDNPRGELIEVRYFMVAEDAKGYRFSYGFEETELGAEVVFQHFAPAVSEWAERRPAYGSQAYTESNTGMYDLRDEMEADLGPNWMSHPQVSSDLRLTLGAL